VITKVCEHCEALVAVEDWYFHQQAHIPHFKQMHLDWCQDATCHWREYTPRED
jgi:hypothetical protein